MTEPPTDADLAALLDEERGASAVRARGAQRWIRQQALEEARLSGVLLSAAEQRQTVTVRTTSGRSHTGTVHAVGADFVAVRSAGGSLVYIAAAAIALLDADRGLVAMPAGDDRDAALAVTLHDVLVDLAGERPDVAVVCAGHTQPVPGELLAVGTDVVSLAVAGKGTVSYVALASVTELSLRASG